MIPEFIPILFEKAKSCAQDKRSWKGLFIGLISGYIIGWCAYGKFFAQHKIAAAENMAAVAERKRQDVISDNRRFQQDKERMQVCIDDLQNRIDAIRKEYKNYKSKPGENSKHIESLLATNNELVVKLQHADIELAKSSEQIKLLTEKLEELRNCYSKIPTSCTNDALLAVVYDLESKLKLRDDAIEREILRLAKIIEQMLNLTQRAYSVQVRFMQNGQPGLKTFDEFNKALLKIMEKLITAISVIRTINDLHLHFIAHVHGNADKIFRDNLLEPTDIFKIKLEADFRSVENARSLLDKMLQLNIEGETFFADAIETLMSHMRTCGKKREKID